MSPAECVANCEVVAVICDAPCGFDAGCLLQCAKAHAKCVTGHDVCTV